jgi:hypothetical protein
MWAGAFALILLLQTAALSQEADRKADQKQYRAPRPTWVSDVAIPALDEARLGSVDDGVYFLLYDTEDRIGASGGYEHYRRVVKKVTSRAGLESAAKLRYRYDPTRERFALHAVRVWRDGAAVDRLPGLTVSTARQEPRLDSGVVDGDVTVFSEIPDIRVGDMIDIELSWKTHDPLWPDGFSSDASLRWATPVGLTRYRLLAPAGRPIATRATSGIAPQVKQLGDQIERVWTVVDADPIIGEDDTPNYYPTWDYVSISTMASWAEVARWASSAFKVDMSLPKTVEDELTRIRQATDQPERRLTLALRYVQETIRYVGDEVGLGSHVPRPPREVVANGFGDCKDKSLLLTAMLRALGFEAYPALTDVDDGRGLPKQLPSPFAFDHAIVQVVSGKQTYWLDPTRTHQGGVFPDIAQPDFGFALPVRAGQEALAPIDLREPNRPSVEAEEVFDLAKAAAEGVALAVATHYRGREADDFRRRLDEVGRKRLAEQFLTYYQGIFPGMQARGELSVHDQLDDDAIDVEETYTLPTDSLRRNGLARAFPLDADSVLDVAPAWKGDKRRTPIALPYPVHRLHVIELRNTGKEFTGRRDVALDDGHVRFSAKWRSLEHGLRKELELVTLDPEVPAADVDRYAEITDAIDTYARSQVNVEPAAPVTAKPNAELDFAGGRIDPNWRLFLTWFPLTMLLGYAGAIVFGMWMGLRPDARYAGNSALYPVSMIKFAVMSVATFGAYTMLWLWRCWRQVKKDKPRPMSPFGRALFGVFYYFPLFDETRRRLGAWPALIPVGVILAVLYLAASFSPAALERLQPRSALTLPLSFSGVLLLLPIVGMINGANRDNRAALKHNSRWTARTVAALFVGLSAWLFVGFGVYARTVRPPTGTTGLSVHTSDAVLVTHDAPASSGAP